MGKYKFAGFHATFLFAIIGLILVLAGAGISQEGQFRTNIVGKVQLLKDISPVIGGKFRCDPMYKFKAGEEVVAAISEDGAWSLGKGTVRVGDTEKAFPAVGILKGSDGKYRTLVLSMIRLSDAIPNNLVTKDGPYYILAQRNLKQGEVFPAYMVGEDAVIALDAVSVGKVPRKEAPAILISKESTISLEAHGSPWMDLWQRVRSVASGTTPK